MSYPPPSGPPPQYTPYPGQQPAPSTYYANPGSVTYVPAPVYMPVYPPQANVVPQPQQPPNSTYVTNIYQQPIPEPVQVVEHATEVIDWVSATPNLIDSLRSRALVAGREGWDSSPLWVIRAHHGGEFVPGKLSVKYRSAYVPHTGREVPVHNFEVLLAKSDDVRWLPCAGGKVPPGAIAAGNTHSGEPLYIARVNHSNTVTPGKVHPSHNCCYISFGGKEISYQSYEVLCRSFI
ncbi:uncharacterized protein LOC131847894 [Achroia grisella]|uniref:uncharacterized protein LOC131847894 n=1 Tax=Achroia grisella TaxID=688607 RepID=UPI0027D23F1A|nr:uncharacterized protein LOC131847894 [Achroia grisella]